MMEYLDCGAAPEVVGEFYTEPEEAMFYLYMPIKMADQSQIEVPERLRRYGGLVDMARNSFGDWSDRYVYLTAKTMFVTPDSPGNRPGWHIDGFGSGGDINFVWSDMNPTEFAVQDFSMVSTNDRQSMVDIGAQIDPLKIVKYPDHTLLRLDERVVHRVGEDVSSGFRSFVKITVSGHKFCNAGNSHNYLLDYSWVMSPRGIERNLDHG